MTASTLPRWPGDAEPAFILQLAQALAPQFDITILAPHCPGAKREENIGGVRIHRFRYAPGPWQNLAYQGGMLQKLRARPLRWLLVPWFLLGQMLSMWRLHRQQRFDLLHAHWILPQGLTAALSKRLTLVNTPTLLTSHGGDLFALKSFSRMKRWVLDQMDSINVVSHAMGPACESLGVPREQIFVRSMGVDLTERFVSSQPFQRRAGIVFVGRLVEKKGVDTLIRAFARLHETFPDERLTIVGDGPLRESLQKLAEDCNCAHAVKFAGAVANEQVPMRLNRARIAVVPSVVASDGDQEGLGLVAVEAMGCGCAVVCSDLPALTDVVSDGKTGIVFAAGDERSLAESVRNLLNDLDHAERIAAAGRESVNEHFGWPSVAEEYAAKYQELINATSEDR